MCGHHSAGKIVCAGLALMAISVSNFARPGDFLPLRRRSLGELMARDEMGPDH